MTVSVPPSTRTRICSRPSRSMLIAATSRVRRTREPFAVTAIFSLALEPLKSSASLPPAPSMVSLPSPGSHWARSSPVPRSTVSAPMLPSTKSSPAPPMSVSLPAPPRSVSSPAPPSTVMALSNAPPLLTTSTWSSPPLALTWMAVNVLRSKVKSAVPSSPTSSANVVAPLTSASFSLVASPLICSVPLTIWALVAADAGPAMEATPATVRTPMASALRIRRGAPVVVLRCGCRVIPPTLRTAPST